MTLYSDLTFSLISGDVMWIQGRNGIGKTTLLRQAAGLSRAETGDIFWQCDENICRAADIIAYQSHSNALKPSLSVTEELSFWSELSGFSGSLNTVLERVGLGGKTMLRTRALSAGQKRRLAIARLIVSGKPLWIMDEPAAAMDAAGQTLIYDVIDEHITQGGAVIIASHGKAARLGAKAIRLTLEAA